MEKVKKGIRVKIGYSYLNRDKKRVGPVEKNKTGVSCDTHPYQIGSDTFRRNGQYFHGKIPSSIDLISEVPAPRAAGRK